MKDHTITIFGASGKVGRLVVSDALTRGYTVRAFVHSHADFAPHPSLTIIKGDIHDTEAVREALRSADSVISTLGSWGTKQKDILSSGMETIIPVMKTLGINRIVSLTGAEARASGDSFGLIHRLSHAGIGLVGGKVLRDSEKHIALLEHSGLDWTIIRSPIMRNSESTIYKLTNKRPLPWQTVPRAAITAALINQLESDHRSQQAPFIT